MSNTDTPYADVPAVGLSEAVTVLTLIGSVLTALFGHDWGVTANAQHYAAQAVIILPIGLSIARAIKHHGAMTANATSAATPTVIDAPGKHDAGVEDVGADLPTTDLTGV